MSSLHVSFNFANDNTTSSCCCWTTTTRDTTQNTPAPCPSRIAPTAANGYGTAADLAFFRAAKPRRRLATGPRHARRPDHTRRKPEKKQTRPKHGQRYPPPLPLPTHISLLRSACGMWRAECGRVSKASPLIQGLCKGSQESPHPLCRAGVRRLAGERLLDQVR